MKYNSSTLFPLLMLLMVAGLTLWLERASQSTTDAEHALRHDPDYIVDNFTVKRFDAQGKLYQTLAAKKMRHYADDDTAEVEMPRMVYYSELKTFLNADKAQINSGATIVELQDNVRVIHESAKGPPSQLDTSKLTVLPNEEIARTQAPVTITQGQSVVHGIGLEAHNKTQTAELGGRVQGSIAPKPQ